MRTLRFFLFLIAFLLPVIASADETCPSLDAATAGGALDVAGMSVLVSHPNTADTAKDDAICDFTKRQGVVFRELRIEVRTAPHPASEFAAYTAHCTSKPLPLKAVGNEALACSLNTQHGQIAAQVVGRLREQIFVIQVRANSGWVSPDVLLEKTCTLADEITGNLF